MRSEIRRLNGDITSLESTVDSLTTSKKSLQKKDKAQAKTITTLESEKSALEEENLNLGVRVEELESNVAQLILKRNESGLSGAYNAIRNKAGRGK
jgi:chromosome segregation ATPase